MRIFVTGASGYIGHATACALARAGHDVRGLIRRASAAAMLRGTEIEPVMGSLQDPNSFVGVAAECEVLIHAAADYQADTRGVDRATVEALLGVADRGPRPKTVIYTSGAWIYGDTGEGAADETALLHPAGTDRTRPEVEQLVLDASRIRGLVVRPGSVYGGRGGLTGMWFEGAEKGDLHLVGDGSNRWSMVHVADLANAYVRLAESGLRGEVFNIAGHSRVTVNAMAEAAVRAVGGRAKITHVPRAEAAKQMGDMAESLALDQHLDASKAARMLGWWPRHGDFADGASRYYQAWKAWRSHPDLRQS